MENKRMRKEHGFTLLEVMLSIVILGIVLLSFSQFFGQSMLFSNKNEARLQAVNIARQLMSDLQGQTLPQLYSSPLSSTNPQDKPIIESLLQSDIDSFTKQFEITLSFSKNDNHLVEVTVTVSSLQQNISAQTYGYMKLNGMGGSK